MGVPATIYTILHTSADADKGSFPPPMAEGSYLSLSEARQHLWELVDHEKDECPLSCDTKDYCEEYGDDYWEAYEDGYGAANFSRYEIIPPELWIS